MYIRGFLLVVCGLSFIASTTSLRTGHHHHHGDGNGGGNGVQQLLETDSGSTTQTRVADVLDDFNSDLVVRQWQLVFARLGINPPAANPRPPLEAASDEPDGPDVEENVGQKRSQPPPQGEGGGGGPPAKKQQTLLQTNERSHTYVPFTAFPFTTARAARMAIRGAGGLHGVVTDLHHPDHGIYVLDGPPYTGRVMTANFNVRLSHPSNPSVQAGEYCDIIWNPAGIPSGGIVGGAAVGPLVASMSGAAESRPTGMWQRGHIVAASLGGDNNDPLNFFPHHVLSNTYQSVWFRMEAMAATMRRYLIASCRIKVFIEFTYGGVYAGSIAPVAGNLWVPDGGFYEIRVSNVCRNRLHGDANFMATDYGAPFVNRAVWVAASAAVGFVPAKTAGYTLRVRWENRPNTAAQPLPVGIALNPGYQVTPSLF